MKKLILSVLRNVFNDNCFPWKQTILYSVHLKTIFWKRACRLSRLSPGSVGHTASPTPRPHVCTLASPSQPECLPDIMSCSSVADLGPVKAALALLGRRVSLAGAAGMTHRHQGSWPLSATCAADHSETADGGGTAKGEQGSEVTWCFQQEEEIQEIQSGLRERPGKASVVFWDGDLRGTVPILVAATPGGVVHSRTLGDGQQHPSLVSPLLPRSSACFPAVTEPGTSPAGILSHAVIRPLASGEQAPASGEQAPRSGEQGPSRTQPGRGAGQGVVGRWILELQS